MAIQFYSTRGEHGGFSNLSRHRVWLDGAILNKSAASPWLFESGSGRWNRRATAMPGPRSGFGDSFHYLPGQGRAWFRHGDEVWFRDIKLRSLP